MKSLTVRVDRLSLLAHSRKPTKRKLSAEKMTVIMITTAPLCEMEFDSFVSCVTPEAMAVRRDIVHSRKSDFQRGVEPI